MLTYLMQESFSPLFTARLEEPRCQGEVLPRNQLFFPSSPWHQQNHVTLFMSHFFFPFFPVVHCTTVSRQISPCILDCFQLRVHLKMHNMNIVIAQNAQFFMLFDWDQVNYRQGRHDSRHNCTPLHTSTNWGAVVILCSEVMTAPHYIMQ